MAGRRPILSYFRASQLTLLGKGNSQGSEGPIFTLQAYSLIINMQFWVEKQVGRHAGKKLRVLSLHTRN